MVLWPKDILSMEAFIWWKNCKFFAFLLQRFRITSCRLSKEINQWPLLLHWVLIVAQRLPSWLKSMMWWVRERPWQTRYQKYVLSLYLSIAFLIIFVPQEDRCTIGNFVKLSRFRYQTGIECLGNKFFKAKYSRFLSRQIVKRRTNQKASAFNFTFMSQLENFYNIKI